MAVQKERSPLTHPRLISDISQSNIVSRVLCVCHPHSFIFLQSPARSEVPLLDTYVL